MVARDPLALLEEDRAYQLILLGGLPGSGKSFYIRTLVSRGWAKFDDFQSKAPENSTDFRDSRFFDDLGAALQAGASCVVADIRLVHQPYRLSAVSALARVVPATSLQFQIYENEPALCSRNAKRHLDRRLESRLREIEHWTNHHFVPAGAPLLRLWRGGS